MEPLSTSRTRLRELVHADAPFVLELLNERTFLRAIGDKGVRTLADAERYIDDGPRASYARYGLGLLLIERRSDREALGIAGLIRRAGLDGPHLRIALLERHVGHGYATEAGQAVLETDVDRHRTGRPTYAVAAPDDERAIRLLDELDFQFERTVELPRAGNEMALFVWAPLDHGPKPRPGANVEAAAELEGEYQCPSCGERIVVPLDVAAGDLQEYVEDCPVCCSPNVLDVHLAEDGSAEVHARAE